ncbi:prevent-host-death family protein [Schaalia suimastitidis]|uniref:prevent-host-death family protein n=1 Tax=Schaalia suimastitidis TaxID=121163 RepID=UPI0004254246|nr:prevent-host-death family protein [Schaalia suimastitidis]
MATFFTRPFNANSRSADTGASETPQESSLAAFDAALDTWHAHLTRITSTEDDKDTPRLQLTAPHPGGLAQLYAEHTTRLSNLVREPVAQASAMSKAKAIAARSAELTRYHGVGPIHLAIGRATWTTADETVSSPALLRPLHVERSEGDILLTLTSGAQLAPEFATALARAGVSIDLDALLRGATTVHGFSSSRLIAGLKEAARDLEHFELKDELAFGIYEHPASHLLRELDRKDILSRSTFIRALAGESTHIADLQQDLPKPNPRDRDPWKELGVGDLTPRQHDAIEAIAAGRSLVIDLPDGADDTTLTSAILADAASVGRTTVHICGNPQRSSRVHTRLVDLGLEEIVAPIDGSATSTQLLRDRLHAAMTDTSPAADSTDIDNMRSRLTEIRAALNAHTTQLHKPFKAFGISAFDALQVLTDLTAANPKPRTKVRLREDILLDIASDRGKRARDLLHRASQLGIFSRTSEHAAWQGIVINSGEQVSDILERVSRLAREHLPVLRVNMTTLAAETGIRPALNLRQWEAQLSMFEGVRDVLDTFLPRIFERSAADMVFATAPATWRREHGITMSRSQRVRLVKQAKDLVRPGVHVKDLHRELLVVQERRDIWRQHCDADGWPTLPQHLDEAIALTRAVCDDIDRLAPVFATSHRDLSRMPIADLAHLFDRLEADPQGAKELPKRVAVLKALAAIGLDSLTQDFRKRHIPEELIDPELDLAWWASVLALMIASEPSLGGFDPVHLEQRLAEGRRLDQQQVDTLAPQVLTQLRRRRRSILASEVDDVAQLQTALSTSTRAVELYAKYPMTRAMVPIVLTVPSLVPWILPAQQRVDLLVLDDVDNLSLAELVPIIARANQVVLLADLDGASSDGSVVALTKILPQMRMEVAPRRLNDQVALLLARHGVGFLGVPVPWTSVGAPISATWVNGNGMPALNTAAVESTEQEIAAVIEAVLAHAIEFPDRSLAVVALNARHRSRIEAELNRALAREHGVASFFNPDAPEPFVVVDPDGARGISRDHVIMTVGYAKTPHGRVIHDFGVLSTRDGVAYMVAALATVRGEMTLISSLRADDIDRGRVHAQGAQMMIDLLEIAEGQSGLGSDSWPTLQAAPDRLLLDLAERLYSKGLEVVPNVGIPGGMRIPLAIGHPEIPGRLLLAVLTDDESYVAQPSQRMRDRVLPALLEAQGWKVYTALSMPVFIDPAKVAETIVQLVLDAVDEATGHQQVEIVVPHVDMADDLDETLPVELDLVIDNDDTHVREEHASAAPAQSNGAASDDDESSSVPARGPRPAVARGLPLAAYGDDQLDELALWIRSDRVERSQAELVELLRDALGLQRRGAQSDAVLGNVIRRTAGQVDAVTSISTASDASAPSAQFDARDTKE